MQKIHELAEGPLPIGTYGAMVNPGLQLVGALMYRPIEALLVKA
jgi:hypothetical protein